MGDANKHKKARVRSPAYPAFDLKTAIEKARTIYQHEKRAPAPVAVVTKHCGLDIKSSGALRLIAALKQFGLVLELGSGDDRKVRLSDRSLDILLADSDSSPQRVEAIKAAALAPKIHKNLWDHYKGELPSDANMKSYLIRHLEFNDAHVDKFIKEFRSTVAFANLAPDDKILPADDVNEDDSSVQPVEDRLPMESQAKTSPSYQTPPIPAGGMRELPITLPSSLSVAVFRVPYRMNETDFNTLVNSLTAMKAALVTAEVPDADKR